MENENFDYKLSVEQYNAYMGLLKQTSLQRAVSTYFFVAINVAIILASWIFLPFMQGSLYGRLYFYGFANLTFLGILLSLYWYQENRESYVLNEVRYRTLIEVESRLFKGGIFNEEWNRLGDYGFRRSPVLFVSLGRILPLILVAMQGVNFGIWMLMLKIF